MNINSIFIATTCAFGLVQLCCFIAVNGNWRNILPSPRSVDDAPLLLRRGPSSPAEYASVDIAKDTASTLTESDCKDDETDVGIIFCTHVQRAGTGQSREERCSKPLDSTTDEEGNHNVTYDYEMLVKHICPKSCGLCGQAAIAELSSFDRSILDLEAQLKDATDELKTMLIETEQELVRKMNDMEAQLLRKVAGDFERDAVHHPSSLTQQHHQQQQQQQQQNQSLTLRSTNIDIVKLINDKYKYGRPSNILGENGLLTHMEKPNKVWSNEGDDTDDGFTHLSCSIINAQNPQVFPHGNSWFRLNNRPQHSPVGFILEDVNTPIQCAFPRDGGTHGSRMKDSEWSGCACLGDNPSQVPKAAYTCMMPSNQLKKMMEESSKPEHVGMYNEVVVSKRYWNEVSPSGEAIMAFFYVKDSPGREEVVTSHRDYLSYTHRNSSQTPLLEYDANNTEHPFIEQ